MKKFSVTIEESVSKSFEVTAESGEEAERIAREKYSSGEFTLCPGNLVCKQMQIQDLSDGLCTNWFEF